jgi:torulene dioxygenase
MRNIQVTLTPNFPVGPKLEQCHQNKTGLRNLYVKTDVNVLRSLDPVTLDPIESTNYGAVVPEVSNSRTSAAHSAVDPETGELFNYALKFGRVATYTLFKLTPPTAEKPAGHKVLATITDAPAAFIHSVCLTKKYFVFCVWQADYTLNGATIPYHKNLTESFRSWDPKRKTLWYIIDRENGGVVRKIESGTFFAFHHINSYDDGDDIIVDLVTFPTHEVVHSFYLDLLRSSTATKGIDPPPTITRVKLENITSSTSTATATITNTPIFLELPTISTPASLRPNKYAYGVSARELSSLWDCIIKVDLEKLYTNPSNPPEGTVQRYERPKCTPSEPIFVPRPGATREDDGVVLMVELDGIKGTSALVVIDGQTFKEVARAEVDGKAFVVPHGFHGVWWGN